MRILRILSGALLVTAVAVAVTAAPAAAHVALVKSTPEDGAKLDSAPETVELTFSEVLDVPSTKVAVTDAAGDVVDQAEPEIEDKTITQPLDLPAKGEYTLSYRIVSEDGHPVEDSISFSVASVPGGDARSGDDASKSATSESKRTDDEADGGAEGSIGWGPIAAIAGGLALLVVVTVLFVRRRSRDS